LKKGKLRGGKIGSLGDSDLGLDAKRDLPGRKGKARKQAIDEIE